CGLGSIIGQWLTSGAFAVWGGNFGQWLTSGVVSPEAGLTPMLVAADLGPLLDPGNAHHVICKTRWIDQCQVARSHP
ncbi:MAG TPA: hypothetical protein VMU20_03265, partial [Candidatus Dormibacteraeota bacterium]|nr:hypothetical protein [Candidatus Dormibacteraeota bacterium]